MNLAVLVFALASSNIQAQSVANYRVSKAGSFPSAPLPYGAMVFRNGIYQTQGLTYSTPSPGTFKFIAGVLSNGDLISVVSFPPIPLLSGTGIMIVTEPSSAVTTATALNISTIAADTVFLSYLTLPPTGPGPCVQTNTPTLNENAGAWATDSSYFYFCVTAPPGATGSSAGLVWARIQYATMW